MVRLLRLFTTYYRLRFAFCVHWFLRDRRRDNVAKQLSYKFYCAVNAVGRSRTKEKEGFPTAIGSMETLLALES